MYSDPGFHCIPLPPLPDKAAVEILNFLQEFTNNFENRYSNQIRRYYDQCAKHDIRQTSFFDDMNDPDF
jgi:hypothetical protein